MSQPSTKTRHWTERDWGCLALGVFVTVIVAQCLWLAIRPDHVARGQAVAVLRAVQQSEAVDFTLSLHAQGGAAATNVTSRLWPRISEDSGALRFDGRIRKNSSEEIMLADHRGYRRVADFAGEDMADEGCLTSEDIPPLHTLESAVRGTFVPSEFASFGSNCSRPVQFSFDDTALVVCAEQWLREAHPDLPSSANARSILEAEIMHPRDGSEDHDDGSPLLVIHGKKLLLELRLQLSGGRIGAGNSMGGGSTQTTAVDDLEPTLSVPEHCEYLEAPMTTGRTNRRFSPAVQPSLDAGA